MAGSAEGLMSMLDRAEGEARLVFPDELGHLLDKASIERASFPYVLNRSYYESAYDLTVAGRKKIGVNCRLSLLGGIVENKFDDLFGAQTVGGL